MSWLQWRDEVWPVTEAEADLHLYLWLPDSACPRQSWNLYLHHCPRQAQEAGRPTYPRWVGVEVGELNLQLDDWRRIADREIRADPAWHDLHETTNEYGHLSSSTVDVHLGEMDPARRAPGEEPHQHWTAHDWILRLGALEGFVFPMELEAWMIPDDDYWRREPENGAEVARFAEGPPNLRAMARTRLTRCSVNVERCQDPVPRAREYLRLAVGLELASRAAPKVEWNSYRKVPGGKSEPRPGWTSVVVFDLRKEERSAKEEG
jgi:hypothetical protein